MLRIHIPPNERKICTISNFITFSRVLLLPFILYFIKAPQNNRHNLFLGILVALCILSDYMDGYSARKLNQVSVLGKILDPLSDKICIGATVIFAVLYRNLPPWIAVVIIARDLIIIIASCFIILKKELITVSNIYGKFTVGFLALLIVSYVFNLTFFQIPLTIVALLSIIVSLFTYSRSFFLTIRS